MLMLMLLLLVADMLREEELPVLLLLSLFLVYSLPTIIDLEGDWCVDGENLFELLRCGITMRR